MSVQLRLATTDEDRAAAYKLRYDLYVRRLGQFLDEADHERGLLIDDDDPYSYVFIATEEGRAVGTSRLTLCRDKPLSAAARQAFDVERFDGVVAEEDMGVASRLAICPEYRGGRLGTDLLAKAYEMGAIEGLELILGRCAPPLLNFHLKRGAQHYGDVDQHPTHGERCRIVVVTSDFDYLRKTRSPMLAALSRRTKSTDIVHRIRPCLANNAVPAVMPTLAASPTPPRVGTANVL